MFRIGQKVVCVDDTIRLKPGEICHEDKLDGLRLGEVYHIRWCGTVEPEIGQRILIPYDPDVYYVKVKEIKRREIYSEEAPFFSWRFAPLQEQKTDIAIFKKKLRPRTKKKLVGVNGD